MCHEILGREGFFIRMDDMLVGSKTMLFCDGVWKGSTRNHIYSISPEGWFHDEAKQQDLTFWVPVDDDFVIVESTCIGGMHVSPFSKCNAPKDLRQGILKSTGSILIMLDYIPILFGEDDIVFYDGRDISVKAFRFPNKVEAEKLAERIPPRRYLASYRIEDPKEIPFIEGYLSITLRFAIPYYEDGKFYLLIDKDNERRLHEIRHDTEA